MNNLKKNKSKKNQPQTFELGEGGYFLMGNEFCGSGKNHIVFVGILLTLYGLILTSAWLINPMIGLLAAVLFIYTKNPFKFKYYKYIDYFLYANTSRIYESHQLFTISGIDLYILNGYIFVPGQYLQKEIKQAFDRFEKELESISA